ncbi:S1C family serine protease [Geminocystis sp.]|uniref:S1C family serine protease n=1 Tax=Geminocystis sp. TaxID=2664100 RepID=UPI0035934ADC
MNKFCRSVIVLLTASISFLTVIPPTFSQQIRQINIENDWRTSDPDVPFSELVKVNNSLGNYYVVFDKNYQKYGGWITAGTELGVITRFTYDEIDIFLYRKDRCDGILGCLGATQVQQGGETIDIILGSDVFTLYGDNGTFPVSPQLRKAFQNLQGNRNMRIVINKTLNNDIGGGTVNQLTKLYSLVDSLASNSINDKIALIPVSQQEAELEKLISNIIPSVVKVQTNFGDATGFILTKNGLIITNRHVVSRSNKAQITFYDKTKVEAVVVRRDTNADIAVLSVGNLSAQLKPLPICYQKYPNLGESVIAIGNPLSLSNTITRGIVSGIRETESQTLIQTDAAVNPGNSGGPLLNKYGEVVGVVNARIGGAGIQGLGFAVSIINALDNLEMTVDKNLSGQLNNCGNPIIGIEINNPQETRPLPLLQKDLSPLPPLK